MPIDSLTRRATNTVIAALLVIAALIVVIALLRALVGRRRLQLVISDIIEAGRLAADLTPGLSASLRQQVHSLLAKPAKVGRPQSLKSTVGRDIENRLTGSFKIDGEQLERIQHQIICAPCKEILSSMRNDLAAVSGGIRALAPQQAAGFVDALAAALPGQRGLLVNSTALTRQYAGQEQPGLSVEIGTLGRAPEALATFWSEPGDGSQRDQLERLLKPAARWIALHVTGRIAVDGVSRWRLGRHLIGDLRTTTQRRALRDILTAQLGIYAMNELLGEHKPWAALAFAKQALVDAHNAKDAVRDYYRPSFVAGAVHERTAACYLALGRAVDPEASPSPASAHHAYAQEAFAEAIQDFAAAESLVNKTWATGNAKHDCIAEIRPERLRSGLHLDDHTGALNELASDPVFPIDDAYSYYNIACLYATAAAVLRGDGRGNSDYRALVKDYLRGAITRMPVFGQSCLTDDDLLCEFKLAELRQIVAEVEREREAPPETKAESAPASLRSRFQLGAWNPRIPAPPDR